MNNVHCQTKSTLSAARPCHLCSSCCKASRIAKTQTFDQRNSSVLATEYHQNEHNTHCCSPMVLTASSWRTPPIEGSLSVGSLVDDRDGWLARIINHAKKTHFISIIPYQHTVAIVFIVVFSKLTSFYKYGHIKITVYYYYSAGDRTFCSGPRAGRGPAVRSATGQLLENNCLSRLKIGLLCLWEERFRRCRVERVAFCVEHAHKGDRSGTR